MADGAPVFTAQALAFSFPGRDLLRDLSFDIAPGLSLVIGGDGVGKSTLLRLMAGELAPGSGTAVRRADTLFWDTPAVPDDDEVTAAAWLATRRARCPGWDEPRAGQHVAGFGLTPHIAKPLSMLSTGSRRKVGLVAAAASGAQLTLLDMPFAALDAPSSRYLVALLRQAAAGRDRAWVVAEHALPAGLAGVRLSGLIDLGA